MSESDFELIVVNAPLPDEFGHELCITAVEQTDAGVVFLVKAAQAEQLLAPLNEQGVLLLSKPFTTPLFLQAMHMAAAGTAPRWRRRCWRSTLTEANETHPQGKGCAGSEPFIEKFYFTKEEGIFLWQNLFL